MTDTRIRGVIAAVPTPFSSRFEIDGDAFLAHARWCLDHGCDALNVLGTTGEANALSPARRGDLMRLAAARLGGRHLMVGTATPDLETTTDLTRLAADLGFAAALVLPPYYYKPVTDDGLVDWFAALVAATAERPIDLYLYNFPQLTGIPFSPALAARLKAAFPDRLKGAKDSSGDLAYARELTAIPDFAVFPSNEVALADAARDGFAGCISATVNIDPASSAALWRQPDDAGRERVRGLRQTVAAFPLVAAVKYLVGRRTGARAWDFVAPPNRAIVAPEAKAVLEGIAESLTADA